MPLRVCPHTRVPLPSLQDVGGEDRPLPPSLLPLIDYVCPNESELARLTDLPTDSEAEVLAAVEVLRRQGARSVLVTLAPRGALLVRPDGTVLRQEALQAPGARVVDATGAGDAFRAAFAVALVEGRPLHDCLRFASAAGGLAVSRMGAVPSLPHRGETEALAFGASRKDAADAGSPGSCSSGAAGGGTWPGAAAPAAAALGAPSPDCPYQFASRLNSMRARRDLAGSADGGDDVVGWIRRQGRVRGLSLVDLNFPQHHDKRVPGALKAAGLAAGAVCMRYPEARFALGALSHPDAATRAAAVKLAVDGCAWAAQLGARDLIIWDQSHGYDYNFEVRKAEMGGTA